MDQVKVLTDEQIDKIQSENRIYAIFLTITFLFFTVLSLFTLDTGKYFISSLFLLILISIISFFYLHRGNFVVSIGFGDEGFRIEKENDNEEFIAWKDIYTISPMNASNRGGKALRITYLKSSSKSGSIQGLMGYRSPWKNIWITKDIGKRVHDRWSEYYGEGRVYGKKKELKKWMKNISSNFQAGLAGWDIVTLIFIIILKKGVIDLVIQNSLYSILPFAIYNIVPVLIGCVLAAVHIEYIRTKKDIERLEKKGAPDFE